MTAPLPALLLAAAGSAVLAACTAEDEPRPGPSQSGSPTADPVWQDAVRRERRLLAEYGRQAATGVLGQLVTDALEHHRAHLTALLALRGVPDGPPSPSVATELQAPSAPVVTPPAAGADAVADARRLLALERSSSDAGIAGVHATDDAALSRLLAQIAASEAQHAGALYIGLREGLVRRAAPATAPTAASSPAAAS